MKYNLINEKLDLKKRILSLNNINEEDLDISKYDVLIKDDRLIEFKEKLLSLRDKYFLIVGDADCDGICSTTIISRLFNHLNIKSNYYIPSRIDEGFGINENIVRIASKHHFDAIIALDNGIANKEIADLCKELDIKYLVIDHHEYEEEIDAYAILHNDLLIDDYSKLSAGGLCALLARTIYEDDYNTVLGGLACLADMVGVLKYNRYLIKKMLEILNKGEIYQINLLAENNSYDYQTLSFNVIPKINTFGRLGLNVNMLVKYLLGNKEYCNLHIKTINKHNLKRKELTNNMSLKAKELIDDNKEIIVVKDKEFSEGICGLVANKLLNELKKPILILTEVDDLIKGSGRSIKDFDLYAYLKDFEGFETFGGHPQALGLSFKKENYEEFLDYIDKHKPIYKEYIENVLVLNEEDLDIKSYYLLEELKPFGIDFKEPLFAIINPSITDYRLMANKYPKYIIEEKCSAISFNSKHIGMKFDTMIGNLNIDRFVRNKLSFMIEDLI